MKLEVVETLLESNGYRLEDCGRGTDAEVAGLKPGSKYPVVIVGYSEIEDGVFEVRSILVEGSDGSRTHNISFQALSQIVKED